MKEEVHSFDKEVVLPKNIQMVDMDVIPKEHLSEILTVFMMLKQWRDDSRMEEFRTDDPDLSIKEKML